MFCENLIGINVSIFPQIKDIINEEEAQFLKTLSRGRRLFNRAADKAVDNSFAGTVIAVFHEMQWFQLTTGMLTFVRKMGAKATWTLPNIVTCKSLFMQLGHNSLHMGLLETSPFPPIILWFVVVAVYFILSRLLYLAFSASLDLLCMPYPGMGPLV